MMKLVAALSVAAGVLLSAPACGAGGGQRSAVHSLEWMSGTWLSDSSGTWIEERWAPPRAGVLMGTSLTGKGNQAGSYDFMRIAADKDGKISFWGSPEGAAPVAFALVSATANELVFENPTHDFPTRIVYRRNKDVLTATISGPGGSGAQSWTYQRR